MEAPSLGKLEEWNFCLASTVETVLDNEPTAAQEVQLTFEICDHLIVGRSTATPSHLDRSCLSLLEGGEGRREATVAVETN